MALLSMVATMITLVSLLFTNRTGLLNTVRVAETLPSALHLFMLKFRGLLLAELCYKSQRLNIMHLGPQSACLVLCTMQSTKVQR